MPQDDIDIRLELRNARRFQAEVAASVKSLDAVTAATGRAGVGAGVASTRFAGLERTLTRVRARLLSFSRSLALGGGIGTAITAVVARTNLTFARQFNQLQAFTLAATNEQHQTLRNQALELGATTSRAATEAASAQTELASAGFEVNEIFAATPAVLNLAIAGSLDMGEAAALVSNQMRAFGLEASEVNRVADILATTTANAKTTLAELGPAFRQVAPVAGVLGVTIEETAASLAALRNVGFVPEQAGTILRNFLLILQRPPRRRALQALEGIGTSFQEVKDAITRGGILEALQLLRDRNLDIAAATQLFGLETAAGAQTLLSAVPFIKEFDANLQNAEGTAQDMRDVMESGLPGSVDEFKSAIEGLQLALGDEGLTATLSSFLMGLTDLITRLRESDGPWLGFITNALLIAPIILGIGIALRIAAFALGGFIGLLSALQLAIAHPVVAAAILLAVGGLFVARHFLGGEDEGGGGGGGFLGGIIPGLQGGGNVREGGLALVGEGGPELLRLPAGARVTPLLGGSGGGTLEATIPIRVDIDGRTVAQAVDRRVAQVTARA